MRIRGQRVVPKILSTLGNMVTASFVGAGGSAYRLFRTFDELQALSDKQLRSAVQYAIDKKYIVVGHKNGKDFIELTKEGIRVVGRQAIESLRPKKQKSWDHKWRVVLFDVPETEKTNRDGFAANLKRLGFVQIQKSAFAFPYPCFEEIEVLADFHQVAEYITCITAEFLDPAGGLEKKFKLK